MLAVTVPFTTVTDPPLPWACPGRGSGSRFPTVASRAAGRPGWSRSRRGQPARPGRWAPSGRWPEPAPPGQAIDVA